MVNDGATNTAQNHQPARLDAPATLPNRNNTSFKTPRNALKINLEPNPNRNKNGVRRVFAGRKPRVTNHAAQFTNHAPLHDVTMLHSCSNRHTTPSTTQPRVIEF